MKVEFDSIEAMLADGEVKKLIGQRAEALAADPERVEKIVLSAPIETVKKRKDLEPFLARQTREEVLKGLTGAEIEVALAGNGELRKAAAKKIETLRTETEAFMGKAREILLEEIEDEKTVDITLAGHDFSHRDAEKVRALGRTIHANLTGTANPGKTTTGQEATPEPEKPEIKLGYNA